MTGKHHTVLEVDALTKVFITGAMRRASVTAVDAVSFAVRRNSIVALVGESGSGKSTIARMIARLEQPTGGTFTLNGQAVPLRSSKTSRQYRRDVQMIFQDPFGSINPAHTVGYSVERPLVNTGHRRGATDRVAELLERVGLTPGDDFADKFPHELSGGQRQRVAIARALATSPSLILADEPTSMLDVSIRMGILNLLDDLRRHDDLSYLYITHDLASARYLSDEILVMHRGRLVEGGATEEVISEAVHPYTKLLLASVPDPLRRSGGSMVATGPSSFDACPWPEVSGQAGECFRGARHSVTERHWIGCAARDASEPSP